MNTKKRGENFVFLSNYNFNRFFLFSKNSKWKNQMSFLTKIRRNEIWSKSEIWSKIEIWSIIEILLRNRNVAQKSKFG